MNCRSATRLLSEKLERPLTRGERIALRFHCLMCAGCRNFGRHMAQLRTYARRFSGGSGGGRDGE